MTIEYLDDTEKQTEHEAEVESDYEEIASETDHVPDDNIDIISSDDDDKSSSSSTEVENSEIEIVDLVHEEEVQDDLADEYEYDENQAIEIDIISDSVDIEEDIADSIADDTSDEVAAIIEEEGNVLEKICDDKIIHIKKQKSQVSQDELMDQISKSEPTRGFINAIKARIEQDKNALIGEAKKASPSKGLIRSYFDPASIANAYEEGGATCLSVLTDEPYFQGIDEFIKVAKKACKLPVLRKDFILDVYQVIESRAIGADCILLIMAILDTNKAMELESKAIELGLDVLIEVHDEKELEQALSLKSELIGINNRDLKSMQIDLSNTERLAPTIPDNKIVVCESGINGYADIVRMNKVNVKTFLVGDALMSQADVKFATQGLLGNVE